MLSNLTPEQMTVLASGIALFLFKTLEPSEANALNNLISLIASNLSVQLAQQALNEEKSNTNSETINQMEQQQISQTDITPLFTS